MKLTLSAKPLSIALLLATPTFLSACATMTTDPQKSSSQENSSQKSTLQKTASPQLTEREWVIEDIASRGIIDSSHATLLFGKEGQLSGSATCNRLIASYQATGNKLTINVGGLTMMACPPALMDQERRLLDLLQEVVSYEFDSTGALIITTKSGKTILAR
ncbi:hypothetical protein HDN1F_25490 [gamma proteobacterium HdN1]|nr:hypothetical protein HDN1F_25490 [gamma proteobacterium HdN1]